MKTRAEMVLALTEKELAFFSENPMLLTVEADFFASGGFNALSDAELVKQYTEATQ